MNLDARDLAIVWAAEIVKRDDILYLDTETTGLNDDDEIIDISVVGADGRVLLNSLVKPTKNIPATASSIHGIYDVHVAKAPSWREVYPILAQLLDSHPTVVIYNADYDTRMIRNANKRHRFPLPNADWQCAMKRYSDFYGEWDDYHGNNRWKTLSFAAKQMGSPMPPNHRALADTIACRAVVHGLAKQKLSSR